MSLTKKYENCEIKYPLVDGKRLMKCIPNGATDNSDYQEILAWVAEGNTIQEAD